MEGLARTGVDLVGLGVYDLKGGRERLRKLNQKSPVDFICANIDGYLPYVRYVKGKGRVKILVTSVVDSEYVSMREYGLAGVNDPVTALRRIQDKIKHDVFIVILHAIGEREQAIISQVPGIDLVINGARPGVDEDIRYFGEIPVVSNNRLGGGYVAYVDLELDSEKQNLTISDPTILRASVNKIVGDKSMVSLLEAYEVERRAFFEKEETLKTKKQQQYQNQLLAQAQAQAQARADRGMYIGARSCEYCHAEISHEWGNSRHAKAIESLISRKKEYDPECLPCHVTGMENKDVVGRFVSMTESPGMAGVQCESCHGPGIRHAQRPEKIKLEKVTVDTCRQCHTTDTDPGFDYEKDRILGTHKLYKNKN